MRSAVSLRATLAAFLFLALALGGCVRRYKPPSANEPHAILKIRRSYQEQPGDKLKERATLNEHLVFNSEVASELGAAPRTDAVLIHPELATLSLATSFGHFEVQLAQESYTEQEPYQALESYNCGDVTSYRTCTRTVTRYRTVYKTRMVNKAVWISDGDCATKVRLAPRVGKTCLVQYDFRKGGVCSASCFEQVSQPDGSFANAKCPAPPSGR